MAQRNYSALLTRGDAALRDDRAFNAIEAYSGAIALRPESMLAYLRRGQTYMRRGDHADLEAAARDFRIAARLDPTATRPLEALGDALVQLQQYGRAASAYERHLRLDDRTPRVTYKLALARYRDGDPGGAIDALKDTLRLDGRLADAHYLLCLCLREQHRVAAAMTAFEKALALAPGLVPAREELAELYGSVARHTDELEQLQMIAGLDRDHVARQVAIGLAHARAGDWDLPGLDRDHAAGQVAIRLAHARAGHWALAVLTLGGALERSPNEPDIYRALGQVWLERPRDDRAFLSKAREALERVASSPAATSETLTLYGRALLQDGDADAAEHALQQATLRFPIDPRALLLYAATAEKQRHLEPARQALIQYGALTANDADLVPRAARIASLSLRLNDPQTAVHWLAQAVAASPNDVRLMISLADAQIRCGDD